MADIQKCADDSQFGQNFILDKKFSNKQKGVIRTRNKKFFKSSKIFFQITIDFRPLVRV